MCEILRFRRVLVQALVFLGRYASHIAVQLPTFREIIVRRLLTPKNVTGCSETSINNSQHMPPNFSEERRPRYLRVVAC